MVGPRVTLGILLLLSALSQVDRGVISLLVGPISHDLGIDDFQISLLQGLAFGLFYAAFGVPCGVIVDRWSRRGLIFWGVVVWSLAAAGCGLATSFNQLLIARFLVGAGEAALYPAAYSLISDLFPRHRLASAIAVFSIGSAVGQAFSMGIGGLLVQLLSTGEVALPLVGTVHAWQAVFLLTGAPGLVLAFLAFLMPEPARTSHQEPGAQNAVSATMGDLMRFMAARRRFFVCHFVGYCLLGMIAFGTAAWIPTLLIRRFGYSAGLAGYTYGAVQLVTVIIGMLSFGVILDILVRRGVLDAPLRLFLFSTPLLVATGVAASFMPQAWLYVLFIGIAYFGVCISGPAATALQLVTPPAMRGRMSAIYILCFNLTGYGLGPSVVAWLTVYVFRDPQAVHLSMATMIAVLGPISWLLHMAGLESMREAMTAMPARGAATLRTSEAAA